MREYRYVYTWVNQGELIVKHIYAPSAVEADEQLKKYFGVDASSPLVSMVRARA